MANLFSPDWDQEVPEPFSTRYARIGAQASAERLGATVWEIEPGGVVSPLHTHAANEEMVIALSGPVTLRTPDGERVLEPGEVVSCPRGRAGAHQMRNRGTERARVLIVSEMNLPEVAVQLDSGKVAIFYGAADEPDALAFHHRDAVPLMTDEPGG